MISRLIGDRFEVLERVGEGDLFQVFKARDRGTSRIVAVKSLLPSFSQDTAVTRGMGDLLPPLTSLAHPNIARLEEVGEEDGAPYLVSEFVRGINLKERIRRIAPFTLSVAVDFAIAIGEALQQAHSQGVVHGDLRSHNVIVSPEGAVKVTDFGLVRALASSRNAYAANRNRAISYLAPEIISGQPPSIGSDIYALGVVLFEMLTGGLPYPGDSPGVVAQKAQNDPVPSPRALNPGVPRSLEGITMKALLKRPEERYGSASEMLADLKSVRDALRFGKSLSWSPLESAGMAAAPAPPGPPLVPPRSQSPTPSARAAAPTIPPVQEQEGAVRMAASTADDRISPYLKAALYAVIFVLIAAGIGFTAFWMATFAKPPEQKFPDLNGMTVEQARSAADKANVRLLVHEEFKDNVNPGVIYQVDQQAGRPLRPGRAINVWVSKGSKMVYVPDLTNLTKDEAEQKIKDSGLTLGAVNREYSAKVPFDSIVSQNPKARKRVDRSFAINLSISDGPKPDESGSPINAPDTGDGSSNPSTGGTPDSGRGTSEGDSARADEVHSVNLTKKIPRDGQGSRRVRIEYDDSRGTHTPVDERHDEGENVTLRVDSYGPAITVRVYYGDDEKPVSERTMRFDKP